MPASADDDSIRERARGRASRHEPEFDREPVDDLDGLFAASGEPDYDEYDDGYYDEPPRGRRRSVLIAVVVLALLAGFAGAGMWLVNQMRQQSPESSGPPPFEIEPVSAKAYVDVPSAAQPPPAVAPAGTPTPRSPRSPGKSTTSTRAGKPAAPPTATPGTTGAPSTGSASASSGARPRPETLDDWATRISAYTDIPQRVLVAYGNAQRTITATDPGCHMSWATLAGIGRAESRHGTHGGATVLANGEESQPIIGPALDGTTPGLQVVHDTDHGALDGDKKWDHALGPMQFLPQTWRSYGMRASHDGHAPDPQNMDDAALTAAHYLCVRGGDLSTGRGWWGAVLTYNDSVDYGLEVFSAAVAYSKASRESATSTASSGN